MAANLTRCLLLDSKVNIISKSCFSTSSILSYRTRKDAERNKTPEYVRKDEYYYQEHPSDEWTNIPEEKGPFYYGVLRDRPDYSFVDGRVAPLSVAKKKRVDQQKIFCEKIVALSQEMDLSKALYQEQVKLKQQTIDNILSSKLKPKGAELLKAKGEKLLKSQDKTRES